LGKDINTCHIGTFSAGGYDGIGSTAGYVKDTIIRRDIAVLPSEQKQEEKKWQFHCGIPTPGILWLSQEESKPSFI
jgi:hypothetical protein